ncbi:MAG: ABC transporter permease [Armatimonadetes bacterium]|nr:ABC transporter permease [Armatimonadota bacterium]
MNTKLWRELGRSRWQFIAVAATVLLGIAFFQGSLISYGNLGRSYAHTYEQLAFGDVWVRMAAAPDTLPRRVEHLPGVELARGRIVEEVRVALQDRPVREVMGRLISLPSERAPDINRVRVVEGRYLSPQGGREVLLEINFARAHDYRVGEFVYPTIQGEEIRFRVVGIVQSPEYIYAIQSEQYLVPTPDAFGVMFIPEREAEVLLDLAGRINEVCVKTSPDRRAQVAALIEPMTDRYGGEEPITREDQPSNKLLQSDLDGYRVMAVVLPLLFLTGTVVTTYTLLARLVQAQSVQIGVLRATGFSQRAILIHFLWLAVLPAVAGGLLGVGAGYGFAWWITQLYVELINIPYMFFDWRPSVVVAAIGIAVAAGLVGALAPARMAARLPPAVAMSQQAVSAGQLPSSVRWLGAGLPLSLRLPLRNLLRRPKRAVYTVLGMVLGVCLLLVSLAILDSVEDAVTTFFEEIERYDITAGFVPEQPGRIITQISSWPGVIRAEPSLDIPVEIERGGKTHATVLSGLLPDSRLRHLTDAAGRRIVPEPGEALLGSLLRNKFNVSEGDIITINYAQNRREFAISRRVRVGPAITQPIGSMVYMGMDDVERLFAHRLGYPLNAVSAALIEADEDAQAGVRHRLHRLPVVASVQTRQQTYDQIQEMMEFSRAFTGIITFFGVGLAFAVVFTSVSINVLERTRELATLRTLGFGMRSIAWFITVENLMLSVIGIGLGIPLGQWLNEALIRAAQTESMTLEPTIFLRTYVIALAGMLLLTILSQIPSFLHLRRLNLAAATKELAT